jgi:hypothetical protein
MMSLGPSPVWNANPEKNESPRSTPRPPRLCVSISAFQYFSFYPFMLLTYLDRMRPGHAFLGTTNLDLVAARL